MYKVMLYAFCHASEKTKSETETSTKLSLLNRVQPSLIPDVYSHLDSSETSNHCKIVQWVYMSNCDILSGDCTLYIYIPGEP